MLDIYLVFTNKLESFSNGTVTKDVFAKKDLKFPALDDFPCHVLN